MNNISTSKVFCLFIIKNFWYKSSIYLFIYKKKSGFTLNFKTYFIPFKLLILSEIFIKIKLKQLEPIHTKLPISYKSNFDYIIKKIQVIVGLRYLQFLPCRGQRYKNKC